MKPRLRHAFAAALLFVLGAASAAAQSPESVQRTFPLASGKRVSVENYKGAVRVEAWDRQEVAFDVKKVFSGTDNDRKWWMEETQVNFDAAADHASLRIQYPSHKCVTLIAYKRCDHDHPYDGDFEASVEVTVRVPRQSNLYIDGYKPLIQVSGVDGDVRIKSYKSPITISGTRGAVVIDTYKEKVSLRDVELTRLDVDIYKGEVEVRARSITQASRIESLRADVLLELPPDIKLDVLVQGTRRTRFSSDFDLRDSGNGDHEGKLNGGGPRVTVQSSRGEVRLRRAGALAMR